MSGQNVGIIQVLYKYWYWCYMSFMVKVSIEWFLKVIFLCSNFFFSQLFLDIVSILFIMIELLFVYLNKWNSICFFFFYKWGIYFGLFFFDFYDLGIYF